MPINVKQSLAGIDQLTAENIFVMDVFRAQSQDIRPLDILIVNLMPTKPETETQLLRLLSNTPLQVNVTLLRMASHEAKNARSYLERYYRTFGELEQQYFDGLIITGAPVEKLDYAEVNYWEELRQIMDWSEDHVFSTLYICWGAQAGLYHHFGIDKIPLAGKLFGIFRQEIIHGTAMLLRGLDDEFWIPHSRHTTVDTDAITLHPDLQILVSSEESGPGIIRSRDNRHVFLTGHSEYDADTLDREYRRDLAAGHDVPLPLNYYPDDDPDKAAKNRWRSPATLLFTNWLNYYVYQETPYDQKKIAIRKGQNK